MDSGNSKKEARPELTGKETKEELKNQTIKWLTRLEKQTKDVKSTGKLPKAEFNALKTNMLAYVKDARHFIKQGDWIRAFEAVIYAYGILETAQRIGIVEDSQPEH